MHVYTIQFAIMYCVFNLRQASTGRYAPQSAVKRKLKTQVNTPNLQYKRYTREDVCEGLRAIIEEPKASF